MVRLNSYRVIQKQKGKQISIHMVQMTKHRFNHFGEPMCQGKTVFFVVLSGSCNGSKIPMIGATFSSTLFLKIFHLLLFNNDF